jgi:hypothetical protein
MKFAFATTKWEPIEGEPGMFRVFTVRIEAATIEEAHAQALLMVPAGESIWAIWEDTWASSGGTYLS